MGLVRLKVLDFVIFYNSKTALSREKKKNSLDDGSVHPVLKSPGMETLTVAAGGGGDLI